jgi:hypothetical protein
VSYGTVAVVPHESFTTGLATTGFVGTPFFSGAHVPNRACIREFRFEGRDRRHDLHSIYVSTDKKEEQLPHRSPLAIRILCWSKGASIDINDRQSASARSNSLAKGAGGCVLSLTEFADADDLSYQ